MVSRPSPISTLHSLLRHRHVKREEIIAFQNKQLRHLIAHAYENVSYYRRLFDREGLKPGDIQSVDDLSKIPVTSREDIQSLPVEEIVARGVNHKKLVIRTTSGSSGQPLIIRRTRLEEQLLSVFRLRAMRYFGLRFTDRIASIAVIRSMQSRNNRLLIRILNAFGLNHKVRIDCRLPLKEIIHKLQHFDPSVIAGSSGVISELSHIVSDKDHPLISPDDRARRSHSSK